MNQIQQLKEETRKQVILDKAKVIAETEGMVSKIGPNHWKVKSSDERYPGLTYDCVFDQALDVLTCSCPHYQHRGEYCKHLLSVAIAFGNGSI